MRGGREEGRGGRDGGREGEGGREGGGKDEGEGGRERGRDGGREGREGRGGEGRGGEGGREGWREDNCGVVLVVNINYTLWKERHRTHNNGQRLVDAQLVYKWTTSVQ